MNEKIHQLLIYLRKYSRDAEFIYDLVIQCILYKYLCDNENIIGKIEPSIEDILASDSIYQSLEEAILSIEVNAEERGKSELFTDVFDISKIKFDDVVYKQILDSINSVEINKDDIDELFAASSQILGKSGRDSLDSSLVNVISSIMTLYSDEYVSSIGDLCATDATLISTFGADTYAVQTKNKEYARIIKMRLILKGIEAGKINISVSNPILSDAFENSKYDVQFVCPGLSIPCFEDEEVVKNDDRFKEYPFIKKDEAFLHIENAIAHMDDESCLAAIVPSSFLRIDAHDYREVRRIIFEKNIIDTVVKLPEGSYQGTTIAVYLLIINNNKRKKDTLFVDISGFFEKNRRELSIKNENIEKIKEIIKNRQNFKEAAYVASEKEVIENEYNLLPEKYIIGNVIKKLLKNETLENLEEVAEIIKPHPESESGKVLSGKCSYPLDYDQLKDDKKSNIELKKGDVVFIRGLMNNMYLVDEELKEPIYASPRDIVIRANKIQPEYLLYYFNTEVGKMILGLDRPTAVLPLVSVAMLRNVRIPKAKKPASEYRRIFEIEHHLNISYESYYELLNNQDKYIGEAYVEELLDSEFASKVKKYKSSELQEFLNDDIRELNACFRAKAYKATLILAGSILEAVLIDWLSEKDGVDYFNNHCYINGKEAVLKDYITRIDELEQPEWLQKDNADKIRKSRNLVHAKLGIKSNEINEAKCREVIGYLRLVLNSRGIDTATDV